MAIYHIINIMPLSSHLRRFTRRQSRSYSHSHKGGNASTNPVEETSPNLPREGLIDKAKSESWKRIEPILLATGDALLKSVGLQRLGVSSIPTTNSKLEGVQQTAHHVANSVVEDVNDALSSDAANDAVYATAQETADIARELAQRFNEPFQDPQTKQALTDAIQNSGIMADIAMEALEEPAKKGAKIMTDTIEEAVPRLSKSIADAVWTALTIVPPVSIAADTLNIANDLTKAAAAATELGTKATEVASDVLIETTDKVEEKMNQWEDLKRRAKTTTNRTDASMREFEQTPSSLPSSSNTYKGGKRKSKRRRKLTRNHRNRRKKTTKRVRFQL